MRISIPLIFAIAGTLSTAVYAEDREAKVEDRLDASADTLADMMKAADKGIPQDLLDKARCVVVVPGMKKAGFIIGAKFGRGFAVCRHNGGTTPGRSRRDACGRWQRRVSDRRFGNRRRVAGHERRRHEAPFG